MTDEQANEQTAEYFHSMAAAYSEGQEFKRVRCNEGLSHDVPINSDGWACCTVHGSDCVNRDCHNCQLANEINETRAKKLLAAGQPFTVPPIKAYPIERGIVRRSRADNIEQRIKLAQAELDKAIAHLGELVKSISELR